MMPMGNSLFSFAPFDWSGIQSTIYFTPPLDDQRYENDLEPAAMKGKQGPLFSIEDVGQVYPLCSEYGPYDLKETEGVNFSNDHQRLHPEQQQQQQPQQQRQQQHHHHHHDHQHQQQQQQMPPKSNYMTLDKYFSSCFPAPTQPMQEVKKTKSTIKPTKDMPHQPGLSSSLELLNSYGGGVKKLNMNLNQFSDVKDETSASARKKLSADEVMRVAAARYVQFSDQSYDEFSMLMHPFGYALCGLSEDEKRNVELAHLLLAAAEKVGYQQYDRASRLLTRCKWVASERADPVQRVVYYFAEALRERIDKATGRFNPEEAEPSKENIEVFQGLSSNLTTINCHLKIPFSQVWQLTTIQTIIENIGSAKKVHLIDFEIRSGVQWTSLMQALKHCEQCSLEHLKITAVGIRGNPKVEETGKRLESFAKSMNFPFTFKALYIPSFDDIKETIFETAADEFVVVVCNLILRTMISMPNCLENLMRVIKNLNPTIMVVVEVEANHNSPNFFNRFIEALFYFSAYFDCLETCMEHDIEHRTILEMTFSQGIRNIVGTEGMARIARSVKMDVWRAFFSRFRMVEMGISESSLYQASLVPKQFPFGNSCTLDRNGECLLVGWKGTPIHSLSTWKFSRDTLGRSFVNYRF